MILVVGGAGYIGSHMCQLLREAGEEHIVFDNLEHGHRQAVQYSPLIEGDIRQTEQLQKLFAHQDIDLVMQFAAYLSVGESVRAPAKYWDNNTGGLLNLLNEMRAHDVKSLVFSSTAAVFGEPESVPIDEDHPKNPTNPYGASKLAAERIIQSFDAAYGFRSVCLRYFNAAGAHENGTIGEDHRPEEHLVPLAILAAMGRRPELKIFGTDYDTDDGTCVRDFIHVSDLADAHLLAARHLRQGGESRQYNLGNGQGFSVRQVLQTVEQLTGSKVPSTEAPRRAGDPARLIASSDRIRRDWAWQPKHPRLERIVETAFEWHRAHPNGYGDN